MVNEMHEEHEDGTEVTYHYSIQFGGKAAALVIWGFLLITIVIGAIGDLLRFQLFLDIAMIMATTFMVIASVAVSILVLIVVVIGVNLLFGKVIVYRGKKH